MKTTKATRRRAPRVRRTSDRREVRIMVSRSTLDRVTRLADRDGKPLPVFLSEIVDGLIEDREGYDAALRRLARRLEAGLDLGTGGRVDWTRDDVHAR